jgi:hypothetical protein
MRKYIKITEVFLLTFKDDAESGNFTISQLATKYNISKRKIYYIVKKHNISLDIIKDTSYKSNPEYRLKISNSLKGISRSSETKQKYKDVAAARKYGNNRIPGTYFHSEDTKQKIKDSNIRVYLENKPTKWLKATIENPEWFLNLIKSAKNRPQKTEEHIRKIVESKVKMPYDQWLLVKTEFEKYSLIVRKLTRKSTKRKNLIEGNKQKGYHLDHIVSIYDGFINDIEPEIISHYINLRYIPAKENLKKNKKSHKSIDTLIKEYEAEKTKHRGNITENVMISN